MTTLHIEAAVLSEARMFFEERGADGCEGTAMIAGIGKSATRLVVPDQVATPVPYATVEVTFAGKLQLATALSGEERYLARIHSHPDVAFHSGTDDMNPAITQEGAVSIVVPFFGLGLRRGLEACAVYVRRDQKWVAVEPGLERDRLVTT